MILQPVFKSLFIETNPIPVKYATYKMGWCENVYRSSMCPISVAGAQNVDVMLGVLNLTKLL